MKKPESSFKPSSDKKRARSESRVSEFYAGGIFYNPQDKTVLLHKRDAGAPINPNLWGLFGGGSEGDETPLQTFIREIREELNIEISPEDIQPLCDYFTEDYHKHRYIFCVKSNLAKSQMTLSEGEGFDWIPFEKVLEYPLTKNTKRDLQTFFRLYKLP